MISGSGFNRSRSSSNRSSSTSCLVGFMPAQSTASGKTRRAITQSCLPHRELRSTAAPRAAEVRVATAVSAQQGVDPFVSSAATLLTIPRLTSILFSEMLSLHC